MAMIRVTGCVAGRTPATFRAGLQHPRALEPAAAAAPLSEISRSAIS
jgi:hypothetical protein